MNRLDERANQDRARAVLEVRRGTAPYVETIRANTARSLRPSGRGLVLRCVSGLVVVTQRGDRDDHELRPGDVFRTGRRGLVVAWAIQDSGVIASTAIEASWERRAA